MPRVGPDDERPDALARIGELDRRIAMLQGEQALVMAEWMTGAVDRYQAEWAICLDPDKPQDFQHLANAERSALAEIALELGLADSSSDRRVRLAVDLVERLPGTLTALRAGRITWIKAWVIREETDQLAPELLGTVEAQVLGKAANLTPGNLRRAARKIVARVDAEAARKRKVKARTERTVRIWPVGEGMSQIHALIPTPAAEAVWAVIDATAHQAITPGDARTIDQARADALVDLVCFPAELAPRISYQIQLVSSDPDLNADATRRLPNAAQARFVKARDQHCVHPGCRATRTEHDHTIDYAKGGPTLTTNLSLRCPRHHRLKHLPGWSATQDPDGTLTLTTPSGRTYRTRPPDADGIDQLTERIVIPESRAPEPDPDTAVLS